MHTSKQNRLDLKSLPSRIYRDHWASLPPGSLGPSMLTVNLPSCQPSVECKARRHKPSYKFSEFMELKVPECVSLRSAGANGIHLKVCAVGVGGGGGENA